MKEDRIDKLNPLFITLGSNINPVENLNSAIRMIKKEFGSIKISSFYKSPAILGPSLEKNQNDYLNAAILTTSKMDADFIKFNILRKIEVGLNRIRTTDKFASRTIDLDIALYGDLIRTTGTLIIPDPDIFSKPHIILPLCDLDSEFIHPDVKITLQEIKENIDTASTQLFSIYELYEEDEFRKSK